METNRTAHVVYFSKTFTAGLLVGLTVPGSLSFPTATLAAEFWRSTKDGKERKAATGGARFRYSDSSFQAFAR